METPDITLVQKLVAAAATLVGAVMAMLLVFDVVTAVQAGAVAGIVVPLGGVYLAADAVIRNGRSQIEAARKSERPYDSAVGK